jgi:CBS-domain-containing membrane protein
MQLREVMTRKVEAITLETSLSEAVQKMSSLDLGALPVCEGSHLVGMVTDRNITIQATAYGHDPTTTPVRNYLSSEILCCFEDEEIEEAEHRLREKHVHCLPVLTRDEQVTGIVTLDELTNKPREMGNSGQPRDLTGVSQET